MKDILVQLDAGHGIETRGKRSPKWPDGSQLFEYQYNRQLVRLINLGLLKYKIKTAILVPEISDIPLYLRVKRSNVLTAKNNSVLISVHGNAGGGSGMEVWTSPGQTKSDVLAQIWYTVAKKNMESIWPIRQDMSDGDADKESKFYILANTACPAILTENGFMDTAEDCLQMMDPYVQQIISDVHVQSILEYIK